MREASKEAEKLLENYDTEMNLRDDFYRCFLDYRTNAIKDGSFKKLDPEKRRYVNKNIQDF